MGEGACLRRRHLSPTVGLAAEEGHPCAPSLWAAALSSLIPGTGNPWKPFLPSLSTCQKGRTGPSSGFTLILGTVEEVLEWGPLEPSQVRRNRLSDVKLPGEPFVPVREARSGPLVRRVLEGLPL